MNKKAALHNLGCKVNEYELEAMRELLISAGYEIVPFAPGADVYVINTCTVTNIADRKSRQMLHKAKKMNPAAIVCAVGCYAQIKGRELERDPAIDLVIGSSRKSDLIEEIEAFVQNGGRKRTDVENVRLDKEVEELEHGRAADHNRSFVKIQDGCNQFCSYCIIPYARGRVRSRKAGDVLEEIRGLAAEGCQETVLTGIHLGSYGTDLGEGEDLLNLIRKTAEIPGIKRIRLGSLEPRTLTEDFIQAIAKIPEVCPHFHLSLQSGCDRTLKRMNRHYTTDDFRTTVNFLRTYYDRPALTTDVITGFPGETEADFEESRAFVEEMHFFETHVFPYSRREGTRAAAFEDQITEKVKKERSRVLIELDKKRRREYMTAFLDSPQQVLIEEEALLNGIPCWCGHTERYIKVFCESSQNLADSIVTIIPKVVMDDGMSGTLAFMSARG
ncbi:MAG: tRNA (N(6)-L-threonylcarbamoyladenosine(37)-C(2))-methylthiotransferase MtaB [Eubacterium sp.]|nr:tRNA (N(6)-L-threonylcarbamoyladenosine(37)-C(2))-methylthiotransferase MtaB [Eubacterium sp.]